MPATRAVVVFTNKSKERLLSEGGTSDWVVIPGNVKKLEYVVCARNSHKAFEQGPDWEIGPEPHGSAFLVGRISDVEFTYRHNDRNRYLIRFSEYAEVSIPDIRSRGQRNPVEYVDIDVLKARGLDCDALTFTPMPDPMAEDDHQDGDGEETSPLLAAKRLIAQALGISPEAVEFTIRA